MDIFNIIAGTASIISLLVTLVTLKKVTNIEKNIDNSVNSKQRIKTKDINRSQINQAGKNINNKD